MFSTPLHIAPHGLLHALRSGGAVLAVGGLAEMRAALLALSSPRPTNIVRFAARRTVPSNPAAMRKVL